MSVKYGIEYHGPTGWHSVFRRYWANDEVDTIEEAQERLKFVKFPSGTPERYRIVKITREPVE